MSHKILVCGNDSVPSIKQASCYTVKEPAVLDTDNLLIVYGCDKGPRSYNQDVVILSPEDDRFAVIDGAGGHKDSSLALPFIITQLMGALQDGDYERAHRAAEEKIEQEKWNAAAAYLVLHIKEGTYETAHAGDVSLVHFNGNGEFLYSTIEERGRNGGLTNAIGRTMGRGYDSGPSLNLIYNHRTGSDIFRENYGPSSYDTNASFSQRDRIILASDGLWDNFSKYEIKELIVGQPLEDAVKKIGKLADYKMERYGGKKDNISLIAFEFK